MSYRPLLDVAGATVGVVAVALIDKPIVYILGAAMFAYVAGRTKESRERQVLQDQISYLEKRGDRTGDLTLEHELTLAHRRLAGLLSSPTFYERARRIMGPMTDLKPGELTEELEAITSGKKTVWDFPDLVLSGNQLDSATSAR